MNSKNTLITYLTTALNQSGLQLGDVAARVEVALWEPPLTLQKKYLLNNACDLLITVKRDHVTATRFLQRVPHTLNGFYFVDIWLADKFNTAPEVYDALREATLIEIQRIFAADASYGSTQDTHDDDHFVGTVKIYNTTITVKQPTYQ